MRPGRDPRAWADALPQIVWAADGSGAHLYFNRRWYEYSGLSVEESLGFGFLRALHPDDVEATLERWERALDEGVAYETECRFRHGSTGAYRWFLARALPVRDGDGVVVRWTGTCTEIESQKRGEGEVRRRSSELEASRRRDAALVELGLEALHAYDPLAFAASACARVRSVLDVELCGFVRLEADGARLVAGAGFPAGAVGRARVEAGEGSQLAWLLAHGGPATVRDLSRETRFRPDPRLVEAGAVAGAAAIVHGREGPYGTLSAHATRPRDFEPQEVDFLQAVANLLGAAIGRHEAEAAANALAQRVTLTLDTVSDGFVTLDRTWTITYLNRAAERILGRTREQLLGRGLWEAYREMRGSVYEREYERAVASGRTVRFEAHFPPLDTWFHVTADPTPDGLAVTFQDVTERRRQEARAELFRRFHVTLARISEESLLGGLDEGYFARVLASAVRLVPGAEAGSLMRREANGAWTFVAVEGHDPALLGLRLPPEAISFASNARETHVSHGFPPPPDLDEPTRAALYGEGGRTGEIRAGLHVPIRVGDELVGYLNLDAFAEGAAFDADARELGRLFARQIASIMQRMELERRLLHQAHTDLVTGIPNRRRAEAVLEERLDREERGAVLFLDLDDFKTVNEVFGHPIGDRLLRLVAARIAAILPDEAVLARWGGDEFMAILPRASDPDEAMTVANRVEEGLRAPFQVGDHQLRTSASIGVSAYGGATRSVGRIVLEADIALNQAKRAGKRQVVRFSRAMGDRTSRRFMIERDLRDALRTGDPRLRVEYQPRVDAERCETVGVEALARWTHPTLGPVSPAEFVPIAESSGLVADLTRRVLDLAVRQARAWQRAGTRWLVSVNLSAHCVRRPDLVEDVRGALERHGLDPALLEFEVTETAAMSGLQESVANLDALRELGVSLSIDDFGTAYSSLTYLRLLPADTLKVDRTFVRDLADDAAETPTESSIVRGIVALARSLGLRVVAEGVETEAQARFLRELGCDGMQGYLFGPAVPAEAVT